MPSDFLKKLGAENEIILAPMGGGPSTPELVAAVSNAGGTGSLAGAYLKPDQITAEIRQVRSLTDKPFIVNLFAGPWQTEVAADARPMLELLTEIHELLGIPAPFLPVIPNDPFPAQLEAILKERPAAFSFTFGVPDADALARLKARGIMTLGTATTLEEARVLANAGVDAIIAQGAEAGAHRGTFIGSFDVAMVPTLELVRSISATLSTSVIASGGLMNGREIAFAMKQGAAGAQLGTAFLACPESGASPAYKQAVLAAPRDTTVITRAFSGRPARGLRNLFIEKLAEQPDSILPYPLQNLLTRAMRTAAGRLGKSEYLSLWAGQGVSRTRVVPAAELVRKLVDEMQNG